MNESMEEFSLQDHGPSITLTLYKISRSWIFLITVIILNLSGGIVGLMYYAKDLVNCHPLCWLIIPDSPLTALAIMLFFIACRKQNILSVFLIVRSARDAVFNAIFLIILDPATFLPGYYELGVVTGLATHAIMIVECVFLIPYLPKRMDFREWSFWAFVLVIEELIDITAGTIPHLEVVKPFLLEFAFFLLLTIIVTLLILLLYVRKNISTKESLVTIKHVN
ncbi:MAG: DUF1405 domain-containing protein [Candidatus Hodarchaeales archaeon]